jgi:hypothetical protein
VRQRLDGVWVERVGDVAKLCPTVLERWKPSPAGFSDQPHNVISWLSSRRLAIYSGVGNALLGHQGCRRMVDLMLRELLTDDIVVVADVDTDTGRALLRGEHDHTVPPELARRVNHRKANALDVTHIFAEVILPRWNESVRRRPVAWKTPDPKPLVEYGEDYL